MFLWVRRPRLLGRSDNLGVKDHVHFRGISLPSGFFLLPDPFDIVDIDSLDVIILVVSLLQDDRYIEVATVVKHLLLCDDPYGQHGVLLANFVRRKLHYKQQLFNRALVQAKNL